MEKKHNQYKVTKEFGGGLARLELVKEQDFPNKQFSLYSVCKVTEEDGEKKYTPLYNETFTPQQVRAFYAIPMWYKALHK